MRWKCTAIQITNERMADEKQAIRGALKKEEKQRDIYRRIERRNEENNNWENIQTGWNNCWSR